MGVKKKYVPGCGCCECVTCSGTRPASIDVSVAGWTDGTCSGGCVEINGLYNVPYSRTVEDATYCYTFWEDAFTTSYDCPCNIPHYEHVLLVVVYVRKTKATGQYRLVVAVGCDGVNGFLANHIYNYGTTQPVCSSWDAFSVPLDNIQGLLMPPYQCGTSGLTCEITAVA